MWTSFACFRNAEVGVRFKLLETKSREIAMQHQLSEVNVRLDRLERENRRLKRTGGFLAGGLVLAGLAAFAAPTVCDVVYAERLVLRDTSGRQRLVMDAYKSESPTIMWHDKDGKAVAKFGLSTEGIASLEYFDKQGGAKSSYRFSPEGQQPQTKSDAAPTVAKTN